jgi:hypothetical protein
LIRVCADLEEVSREQLAELQVNEVMLGNIRRAHDTLGRIIELHHRRFDHA